MRICPLALSRSEVEEFYDGMSNQTFWPLYHDAIRTPEFHREWWQAYEKINQRFADLAAHTAARNDLVWVHDYHLQLVPAMLRERRPDLRIGFFLHIPFPPDELFAWLPWRTQVLRGLLGADVIGFQTRNAVQNFARLCREYAGTSGSDSSIAHQGRSITCQAYPISIDYQWFDERARTAECDARVQDIRTRLGPRRRLFLAVDRLDYTKGILRRLRAFEELLNRGLASVDDCVLVQIATPSRDGVLEYASLRDEIEMTVGRINGRFSHPGRVAVHYFRRNLAREDLIAYYAAADVMLVTPLRDGMNLVAKEYVACRTRETGVLVLSQFAGAARELTKALIVNPRDIDQLVEVMQQAMAMQESEARSRMRTLRARVERDDVYTWCDRFIGALRG